MTRKKNYGLPSTKEGMIERGCTPFSELSKERRKEIAASGGRNNTPAHSQALKLSWIRRRMQQGALKSADEAFLLERVENNKVMALDIINWIDEFRKNNDDVGDNHKLMNIYLQAMKQIHGEKIRSENVNYNVSVNWNEILSNTVITNEEDEVQAKDNKKQGGSSV